jgi:hypothetical protein
MDPTKKARELPTEGFARARRASVAALTIVMLAMLAPHARAQSPAAGSAAADVAGVWIPAGSLHVPRTGHTATLLANGKVLVAGGINSAGFEISGAELYDPASGTWSDTQGMHTARTGHAALRLQSGKVLVVGADQGGSAEIYDPASGTWSATGSPAAWGFGATATLLPNGKVLVVGGEDNNLQAPPIRAAELYDPASGTWSAAALPAYGRFQHTATLLQNGKVLVFGGIVGPYDPDIEFPPMSTAEVYDPASNTWSLAGAPIIVYDHTATLLADGSVLVAGGAHIRGGAYTGRSVELFDPASASWRYTTATNQAHFLPTATALPDGNVLLVGAIYDSYDAAPPSNIKSAAELYVPDTPAGTSPWVALATPNTPRANHTATLLTDGSVLVAGGIDADYATLGSAERFVAPASAGTPAWRISALFSDQAGLAQYILLEHLASDSPQLAGLNLSITSVDGVHKAYTFATHPRGSATVCLVTQNVRPASADADYVIPDGFVATRGGTITLEGIDSWTYGAFAQSGAASIRRDGTSSNSGLLECSGGLAVTLTVPDDPVIEYYNAALDHYFMTASQPDLDALDSGRISGWARTGERFRAWTTRDAPATGTQSPPPDLSSVCRLYLPPADGDSHFYSASSAECATARAQHPEYMLETGSAFLATLPNAATGACPDGQAGVYRLWNGRIDSNHRFTTSTATRDLMLAQHYIAEGYGPDGVAMCVKSAN